MCVLHIILRINNHHQNKLCTTDKNERMFLQYQQIEAKPSYKVYIHVYNYNKSTIMYFIVMPFTNQRERKVFWKSTT